MGIAHLSLSLLTYGNGRLKHEQFYGDFELSVFKFISDFRLTDANIERALRESQIQIHDALLKITNACSPSERAKQKRIEHLLFVLTLVKLKRFLQRLYLTLSFVFDVFANLIVEPTRSARITPFIYFP